jgi:alpha-tubulin suppressor-like RCC1 family protein
MGQLGLGLVSSIKISRPTYVELGEKNKIILMISCGNNHSLILIQGEMSNKLYVFGSNHDGQLGLSR